MHFKSPCLFIMLAICMACFFGCSRESSIKENVNLRNNHSVVFAFNKPFENEEAFADSIINLSNPDSVLVYDTLTVTINDTVYLMGFLRYNSDKIYRYIWHFEDPYNKDNKDTLEKDCEFYFNVDKPKKCNYVTENSSNAKAHFRVFKNTGIYSPLFIAIDGNNARDTAGVGQYIRVIDTPPYVSVPKDTLWTKSKGMITFPIVALDSFGSIKSLKIDLDASGKSEPQDWNLKKLEGDSLEITIKYDSTKVDSLGNQKIYVIATDDDGNETKDSVNLHFNLVPKLKLISPEDNSTQSEVDRLILHYEAIDKDNPAALRYFIRAANPIQSDTSIEEFVPNFTDRYLINNAINIKEPYFVAVDANGVNQLGMNGRIYWDVWVTDGYDTVYAEKIKEKDGTLRPRTFLLVDLKNPYGVFRGYAKYQGKTGHKGILIELKDSVNTYPTTTNEKGYFSVNVPSGTYRLIARDTAGYGFTPDTLSYRRIEIGQTLTIPNIVLKDSFNPSILIDEIIDSLYSRSVEIAGKVKDIGSQIKNVKVTFDGEEKDVTFFGGYNPIMDNWTWRMQLDDLSDGKHEFTVTATDSAGLYTDSSFVFYVIATNIQATVNGKVSNMIDIDEFTFKAKLSNADPLPDTIFWLTHTDKDVVFYSLLDKEDSSATLKIKYDELGINDGKFYEMYASNARENGVKSNSLRYGHIGSGIPVVYFENTSHDTTISINDPLDVLIYALANNKNESSSKDSVITFKSIPTNKVTQDALKKEKAQFLTNTEGVYKVIASLTNGENKTSYDTLTVNVVKDPPSIKLAVMADTTRLKINDKLDVHVKATDKFGTINSIEWGCSNGNISFDNKDIVKDPANTYTSIATINLPGTETNKFKCVFKATDDDNQSAFDTLSLTIILGRPFVALNIKQQTLTINDETEFSFFAGDSIGTVVKYEKTCSDKTKDLKEWEEFTGTTTVTMPSQAGKFYCSVRVTDDDGLTALDTAEYNVLKASPSVSVMGVSTVTIKDEVKLDADARDSTQYYNTFLNGSIEKYEWGCGSKNSNIQFTHISTKTPEYTAIMPDEPDNDYLCIIQVTDDDGNTARDTAHIVVILDPPSVQVKRKAINVREGFNIILDATARDGYGFIAKYEWSCGTPSTIENNWKAYDKPNTSWIAPAAANNFKCIVRVTDDDGNTARDTTDIIFSTGNPIITVHDEIIYVMPGQSFELSASKNDTVWTDDNVSWFKWQCYYNSTKDTVKGYEPQWSFIDNIIYDENDKPILFSDYKDSSYTEKGEDIFCVVTAEEFNTGMTYSDTTQIRIIVEPPKGVITAADTVFVWSGDSTVSDEGIYFYTPEWGGMNSTMGPIGDASNQKFNWQFSNVGEKFYEGNKNGTLDTSKLEFNKAFIRSTTENSRTFCLDYRDSNKTVVDEAFYLRHRADETCRTFYFRKAWKNLAQNDTVLAYSKNTTAPVLTVIKQNPIEVYLASRNTIGSKYYNGVVWTNIDASSISISDSITSLSITNNGNDAFLAILSSTGTINVYKSKNGTSTWAILGSNITGASSVDITCKIEGEYPTITYIKTTDKKPYFANLNNNLWKSTNISSRKQVRDVKGTFTSNGEYIAVYVDNSTSYQGFYALYNSSFTQIKSDASIVTQMNGVDLSTDGNLLYVGYSSRVTENYGPVVMQGTINNNTITFSNNAQFRQPITQGKLINKISIASKSGRLYAIFDDNGKHNLAQSHTYTLDGNVWKLYGENELPYFKVTFYNKKKYYLRGAVPDISIGSDNKVYISMLAWENAGGNGNNFGPIVMKYVADSWMVH